MTLLLPKVTWKMLKEAWNIPGNLLNTNPFQLVTHLYSQGASKRQRLLLHKNFKLIWTTTTKIISYQTLVLIMMSSPLKAIWRMLRLQLDTNGNLLNTNPSQHVTHPYSQAASKRQRLLLHKSSKLIWTITTKITLCQTLVLIMMSSPLKAIWRMLRPQLGINGSFLNSNPSQPAIHPYSQNVWLKQRLQPHKNCKLIKITTTKTTLSQISALTMMSSPPKATWKMPRPHLDTNGIFPREVQNMEVLIKIKPQKSKKEDKMILLRWRKISTKQRRLSSRNTRKFTLENELYISWCNIEVAKWNNNRKLKNFIAFTFKKLLLFKRSMPYMLSIITKTLIPNIL